MIQTTFRFDSMANAAGTEVIVQVHPEFDAVEMHTHEFIEIAFVASGVGWHVLGEQITRCEAGHIFLIDLDDPHMFVSEHDDPLTIYNLMFRPGFFGVLPAMGKSFSDVVQHLLLRSFRYGDFSHSLSAKFEKDEIPLIHGLFQRMLLEYTGEQPGFEELIRSWTVELLVYIFRKLSTGEETIPASPDNPEVLNRVLEYIQQNFTDSISLEKLAMLAFVSPKYFSRLFKNHTGLTVTEYTQKLRVNRACEMLTSTNLTIVSISEQAGYRDVKHFKKVFQRLMGVSPMEFRCSQKKK